MINNSNQKKLCWICPDNDATTREHIFKQTDIKQSINRPISQKNPIYFRSLGKKAKPVGSSKSDTVKFKHKICDYCNSTRTQNHDNAWKDFSAYLFSNIKRLARDQKVDLSRIFPGKTNKSKVDLQLYFVKLFGCIIVEHNLPIEIESFSQAICSNTAHNHLYLEFILLPDKMQQKILMTCISEPVFSDEGNVIFTQWNYRLCGIVVNMIYCVEHQYMTIVRNYFHPNYSTKMIRLNNGFQTNHNISWQLL